MTVNTSTVICFIIGKRGDFVKFQIKANTAETMDDFMYFFDQRAFRDNPEWSGCYCLFPHKSQSEWENATASENRMEAMVRLAENNLPGYLGYLNNEVIAWMAVGPRKQFKSIHEQHGNQEDLERNIVSITCVTIDPDYRNQGIATAMLERVLSDLKSQGIEIVEAYPLDTEGTNAHHHRGPLHLYQKAGFTIVDQNGVFTRVRKTL